MPTNKKTKKRGKSKISQAKNNTTVTFNASMPKKMLKKIDTNANKMGLSRSSYIRLTLQPHI